MRFAIPQFLLTIFISTVIAWCLAASEAYRIDRELNPFLRLGTMAYLPDGGSSAANEYLRHLFPPGTDVAMFIYAMHAAGFMQTEDTRTKVIFGRLLEGKVLVPVIDIHEPVGAGISAEFDEQRKIKSINVTLMPRGPSNP